LKVVVFGATGGTGRQLVRQATDAGHEVTAVTRSSPPASCSSVRWLTADLSDQHAVAAALAGQDAVLSALGPTGRGPATICADATERIAYGMPDGGRLVVLSAYGAGDSRHRNLYNRLLWLTLAAKMRDKEAMEQVVRSSRTEWTIVRPSFLTNGPGRVAWRAQPDLRMRVTSRISRADVAAFMLAEASNGRFVGQAVSVTT
jgi:uncharacterized protein YbjT (DUF2867 family)